jgi:stringent starvation protein B
MRPSPPLPPKKEVALALLAHSSVFIHLDPRVANVVVPVWFKKQPQLVLQIGLNMPVPIQDLHVDDDGLSCTLSFNRSPFHCMVPWAAVYAMVDDEQRAMVWPDDVPPEVQRQVRERPTLVEAAPPPRAIAAVPAPAPATKKDAAKRPKLAPVPADAAGAAPTAKKSKSKAPKTATPAEPIARLSAVPSPPRAVDAPAKSPERLSPKPRPQHQPQRQSFGGNAARTTDDHEPAPVETPPAQKGAPRTNTGVGPGNATGNGTGRKPKRELPPYLRVVK